jgi:hypothetical protein
VYLLRDNSINFLGDMAMIDYEKLREAHELAEKIPYCLLTIRHSKHDGTNYYLECPRDWKNIYHYCEDIDDLLIKLKELTQPKPKYQVGQYVWVTNSSNKIIMASILEAHYTPDVYRYDIVTEDNINTSRAEFALYPSREALIQSQIDHWTCLQNEEISTGSDDVSNESTCEHVSNGIRYARPFDNTDKYVDYKCISRFSGQKLL